ncbi:MAG: hypothetical protein R3C59_27525 [Planctomycetaceae bacterium]
MTNESSNNNRLLNDDRMDQLLAAFYDSEVPERLDRLPSSWPELQPITADVKALPAGASTQQNPHQAPTVRRGIAVAAATLAACLMLMVFTNSPDHVPGAGTAKAPIPSGSNVQPLITPETATFPVSGGSTTGAVDENNTTLEEIENIDLSPMPERGR